MSAHGRLHLTMLQILGSPIHLAPHCPSKHGVQVAKSLHVIVRNMGLLLEAVVARWLDDGHPVSKEL